MPYTSIRQARIKKLNGVVLSLDQVNDIANTADAIGNDGWPIAISQFKKTHVVKDGRWVAAKDADSSYSVTMVTKQDDGSYWIRAISTAAIPDREDETFTIAAIDYDIQEAKKTGIYPEFRLFHKEGLAIGRVEKMSRVGIFAVDEGRSYTDPFSLQACEKMLLHNEDGRWRVSRGFNVYEASGNCVVCNKELVVGIRHMLTGFKCPSCSTIHLKHKSALSHLKFLKAKSFDITITDIPCVPWTGVTATRRDSIVQLEDIMTKKDLRKKLLDAGFSEDVIDEKLKSLSDEQLKEYKDIPEAVLKELEDADSVTEEFVLDDAVLKEFASIVDERVTSALENMELSFDDMEVELKGMDEIISMKEDIAKLKTMIESVSDTLEDLLDSMSAKQQKEVEEPKSRLKIRRMKAAPPPEDDEDDMEEEDEEEEVPTAKKSKMGDLAILDADGNAYESMTQYILGSK